MRILFFVFSSIFFLFFGCVPKKYELKKIDNQSVKIDSQIVSNAQIDQYIQPYRTHIQKELDFVLAYNPNDLTKKKVSDKILNTSIGNFMAEVAYQKSTYLMQKQGEKVSFALLNWGGIRSSLPKGDLTKRSAFELMPFDNRLVVAQLSAQEVLQMAQYLITEKAPHPISENVQLHFNSKGEIISFKIDGQELNDQKLYWVCTTDDLVRGGDRMDFFKKHRNLTDLNYNFRNAIIDYFTEIDTLKTQIDNRFIQID